MKIGVAGFFGYGNPGDEIILQNFKELHKENQITIFPPRETYKIPKSDIQVLYFPGGGIFYDKWIQNHFSKQLVKKIDIPIILLAIGIPHGEKKTLISRRISYFVKKVNFFGFRDSISKYIFQKLWNKKACLIPDLGYLTKKYKVKRNNIILIQKKGEISSGFRTLTPPNRSIITSNLFQKILTESNIEILEWNNFQEAIKKISQAKGLICESLHAGIIASTQNTPFSIIQYQEKIPHVLRIVSNSNRIFYPKKDLNYKEVISLLDIQNEEKVRLKKTQKYIINAAEKIFNSLQDNNLDDLKINDLVIPQIKKEDYFYGRQYKKLHRKIFHFLENLWI
jgi:polysaccharide pyruvyl transferase WcaK-like protein